MFASAAMCKNKTLTEECALTFHHTVALRLHASRYVGLTCIMVFHFPCEVTVTQLPSVLQTNFSQPPLADKRQTDA